MRHSRTLTAAALTVGVLLVPAVAQAGPPDTTPPTLSRPVAHYVLGTQVDSFQVDDGSDDGSGVATYVYDYNVRWNWKASDASKICLETLTHQGADAGPGPEVFSVKPSTRSFGDYIYGYDAAKGGSAGYLIVKVKDCAGNTSTSAPSEAPYADVDEDTDPSIAYRRAWGTSYFTGFSPGGKDGTTHYTTEKGASFVTSVAGGPLALVMERRSDRGSAAVYIDGKQVTTVNTYTSGATVHRSIVWATVLSPGTHTMRVVNLATPGHPRIDLDLLLN